MPLPRSLLAFAATLALIGSFRVPPAAAVERIFVLSPADLVSAADLFGAKALARSATLKKAVGLRRGALRFAKGVCPSLRADATRKLTRIRVLGGPAGAPLVVGRSLASGLTDALAQMNAATWQPPAAGFTLQPAWIGEAPAAGAIGFATLGFATGDQTGAIGQGDASNRTPSFRVTVDLAGPAGAEPVEIALALTAELAPKKPGKPGKRTECILVASLLPVDIHALRALLAATPLIENVTRSRLSDHLDTIGNFLASGATDRAARNARTFALDVATRTTRTGNGGHPPIPPTFAEAMINRANALAEALCLDDPCRCKKPCS